MSNWVCHKIIAGCVVKVQWGISWLWRYIAVLHWLRVCLAVIKATLVREILSTTAHNKHSQEVFFRLFILNRGFFPNWLSFSWRTILKRWKIVSLWLQLLRSSNRWFMLRCLICIIRWNCPYKWLHWFGLWPNRLLLFRLGKSKTTKNTIWPLRSLKLSISIGYVYPILRWRLGCYWNQFWLLGYRLM